MKTSKYQVLKTIALCVVLLAAARTGKAQIFPNSYINVDWQVGVPLGSAYADKASGWGMNFEGGYFITPSVSVGPFISYQTNLSSIPRQTLDLGDGSALTVNQKHGSVPAAVRRHGTLHMASGQRIPALCGSEAGRQLCRILVLLLRNQAVHRHVGILPLARNRR